MSLRVALRQWGGEGGEEGGERGGERERGVGTEREGEREERETEREQVPGLQPQKTRVAAAKPFPPTALGQAVINSQIPGGRVLHLLPSGCLLGL